MSEAAKRMRQTHVVTGDKWFLAAAVEIERLQKMVDEYANHHRDCQGGDGSRCQCGYLDAYTELNSIQN